MELIDLVHIGLYLVNLIILFFIVKHFLYKPVTKFLNERKARVEKQYEEADEKMAEVEALKSEYEGLVADAKAEASDIVAKANEHAADVYNEMIEKGKKDVEDIKIHAQHELDLQRRDAYNKLRSEVLDMSIQLAGKVLEREVTAEDNKKVIDDFFESVG